MKRLIALLLAVAAMLSLAACAGDTDTEATTTAPTTTAPTTAPTTGESSNDIVIDSDDPLYTKKSYTTSNDDLAANSDVIAATTGDSNLTVGELQVYYWMSVRGFLSQYSYYLTYFGLDYTKPLDEQKCSEIDGTWQHYFLNDALSSWHNYQSLVLQAKENGSVIDPVLKKELDELPAKLAEDAEKDKYASADAMLQAEICPGITVDDYIAYLTVYYTGYSYFQEKFDKVQVSNDEIEKYFNENQETLAESKITKDSGKIVNVRHILLTPKGDTEDATTYTDEQWEACRVEAQKLLDEWTAGKATEDSFAELANKHSVDPGSNTNGGLYEGVYKGQMVEPFENWCFDESRKTGDTGLVKTEYGYHIMYFVSEEPQWVYYCREELLGEKASQIVLDATSKYLMTVNYDDIVLGVADLVPNEE